MTPRHTARRLLACYPAEWRARYGEELEELIVLVAGDGPVAWRVRADVVCGGMRERARLTLGSRPGAGAEERARDGLIAVLAAWVLFAFAGAIVAKTSEHWATALAGSVPGVASAGFTMLQVGAALAGALALVAIALSVPGLGRLLRAGGWPRIRGPVRRALGISVVALVATAALVMWAHHLSAAQREGHDDLYAAAFLAWAALGAACLAAWTAAAAGIARTLAPAGARRVRAQARLATAVVVAMAVMASATLAWWIAVALRAPAALTGTAVTAPASPWVPQLLVSGAMMVAAIALGTGGARRALRAPAAA
jgi:hypothetical protein